MVKLATMSIRPIMALYKQVPSWVGTPSGQTINSFADFAVGTQRMETSLPPTMIVLAFLSPADFWGMLGSQTALYIQDAGQSGSLSFLHLSTGHHLIEWRNSTMRVLAATSPDTCGHVRPVCTRQIADLLTPNLSASAFISFWNVWVVMFPFGAFSWLATWRCQCAR